MFILSSIIVASDQISPPVYAYKLALKSLICLPHNKHFSSAIYQLNLKEHKDETPKAGVSGSPIAAVPDIHLYVGTVIFQSKCCTFVEYPLCSPILHITAHVLYAVCL